MITGQIIFVIVLLILYRVWTKRKFYRLSWKLPGPFAWPIIGNALYLTGPNEDIFNRLVKLFSSYPSPMRVWLGPKFMLVFSDVKSVERIMTSPKFSTKDNLAYKFTKIFAGEAIDTCSGLKWKHDRRLMSPMFSKDSVDAYYPKIRKHVNYLVELLDKEVGKPTFDVRIYIQRCFADVLNETVIGVKTAAQDGELDYFSQLIDWFYVVSHVRVVKAWLAIDWIFRCTKYYRKQEKAKSYLHAYMRKAIETNSKVESKDGVPSFLHKMLQIRDETTTFGEGDDMVHQLFTLYAGGQDPIVMMCSFALMMMGMHPKIQDKVAQELTEFIRSKEVNIENLGKLTYLDMCIKETLRLFPVAPFLVRRVYEDIQVGDTKIPKGSSVVIAIYNMHKDPKYWQRPDEFYPEHFLPEHVANRSPYAYMPFSSGPRACIGKGYAYLSMKVFLATVLRNFVVESDGKLADIQLKTDFSVRIRDDFYPLRIKRRN